MNEIKASRLPTEYEIQRDVVKKLRKDGYLLHGDANGVYIQNMGTKKKMQASGLLKGYPDLTFILENGIVLWVELKRKGNTAEAHQIALHEKMRSMGHKCEVVIAESAADAYLQIKEHIENANPHH